MLLESLYGLGVGLALGMTGGGGVLAVPALVLGLGYSLPEAAPVALVAVGVSAFLGGLDGLRRGLVRYKAALLMALGGCPAGGGADAAVLRRAAADRRAHGEPGPEQTRAGSGTRGLAQKLHAQR